MSMPSWRSRLRRARVGGAAVVMGGRTAVSVVMPSSLAGAGARTHPADWPIGSRAGPTMRRLVISAEMLVGRRATGCPVPAAAGSYGRDGRARRRPPASPTCRGRRTLVRVPRCCRSPWPWLLATSGCTAFSERRRRIGGGAARRRPCGLGRRPRRRRPRLPTVPLTVLADPDPVASAAAMSRALFDRAPVVVVARVGDRAGELLAASAAVGLGVPLLLEPEGGGAADAVADRAGPARRRRRCSRSARPTDAPGRGAGQRRSSPCPADPARRRGGDRARPRRGRRRSPTDGAVAAVAALDPDGAGRPACRTTRRTPRRTAPTTVRLPDVERGRAARPARWSWPPAAPSRWPRSPPPGRPARG